MTDNRIRIPGEKAEMLREICRRRTGGMFSAKAIYEQIESFLKDRVSNMSAHDKEKSEDLNKLKETYRSYQKSIGSPSSFKNALGNKGVSRAKFAALPEIIDLYIEHLKFHLTSAETIELITSRTSSYIGEIRFSPDVEAKISDLVNCFCSFPKCGRATKAAALDSPATLIVLGRACMIYGPVKDAPRYDPGISIDFYGTDNGIWMCSRHADLVNGRAWVDYPATKLLQWRKLHQVYVYELVTGIKNITGIGFQFESGGSHAAAKLLNYINDQEFLYTEPGTELVSFFTASVSKFRTYLEEELLELKFPVFISRQVSGIIHVCNAFMDIAQNVVQFPVFADGWLVFKKVIGNSLDIIAKKYKVQMPARLRLLAPISTEST
jgi:hypothetical protein